MKNLYYFYSLLFFINGYSQCNNIVNLDGNFRDIYLGEQGYYYKDLNNVLNAFEGTYLYTNGAMSFKIKLQKKTMSKNGNYNCEDMIIGGAEYISDGLIIFNSIPLLNTFYEDGYKYKLVAKNIYTGDDRNCDECGVNEKWLGGHITDPLTEQSCEIFIRKINHNGQEALKVTLFIDVMSRVRVQGSSPPPMNIPYDQDFMILIKQP